MIRAAFLLLALAAPLPAPGAPDCAAFPFDVRLCTEAAGLEGAAPSETGPTRYFAGLYGAVLEVAPLSASAHSDPAFMRANLDAYLAAEKGFPGELPALHRDRIDLGDRIAAQVVYALEQQDGTTIVADTLVLGDGFGVYLQTFDLAEAFTDEHRAFHDRVLGALHLPPPDTPGRWTVRPPRAAPPRPLAPEPSR